MPSFLSKVFGRKRQDGKEASTGRPSYSTLLDGKFEAISPNVSPSAANFPDGIYAKEKDKDKDATFTLFRSKSRQTTAEGTSSKSAAPHLTLDLSGSKTAATSPALDVVFDSDSNGLLSDSFIGERRLTPAETLKLVQACSQAITARGQNKHCYFIHMSLTFRPRPRSPGDHASALVLRLPRNPAQTHLPLSQIPHALPRTTHALSDISISPFCF